MAVKTLVDRTTASAKRAGSASSSSSVKGRVLAGGAREEASVLRAGVPRYTSKGVTWLMPPFLGSRDVSEGDSLCKVIPTEVMFIRKEPHAAVPVPPKDLYGRVAAGIVS